MPSDVTEDAACDDRMQPPSGAFLLGYSFAVIHAVVLVRPKWCPVLPAELQIPLAKLHLLNGCSALCVREREARALQNHDPWGGSRDQSIFLPLLAFRVACVLRCIDLPHYRQESRSAPYQYLRGRESHHRIHFLRIR